MLFCQFGAQNAQTLCKINIPSLTTTAYWDRSSTTASMIMQHPDVYNMACKYNYFGVVKPEVMKEYAAEAERMKRTEKNNTMLNRRSLYSGSIETATAVTVCTIIC